MSSLKAGLKKRIHVNQHAIKANCKDEENRPVITVKTYKDNIYGHNIVIKDNAGNEIARVIYSPDKPLSCGARVWVETSCAVDID